MKNFTLREKLKEMDLCYGTFQTVNNLIDFNEN